MLTSQLGHTPLPIASGCLAVIPDEMPAPSPYRQIRIVRRVHDAMRNGDLAVQELAHEEGPAKAHPAELSRWRKALVRVSTVEEFTGIRISPLWPDDVL